MYILAGFDLCLLRLFNLSLWVLLHQKEFNLQIIYKVFNNLK